FDAKHDKESATSDKDSRLLAKLVEELSTYDEPELADNITGADGKDSDSDPNAVDDDPDDEADSLAELSKEEREAFEQEIIPVKLVLVKIRTVAFKIIHSTTKLLPRWKELCVELGMLEKLLPRDVHTRWNSTFDMLEVALKYRKVVDAFCEHKPNGL
ncbi:hypothetical protein C8T65DRAFT_549659, partial [Cerioporus squamosus]